MMTNASPFGRRKKSTGQMDFKVVITGIRGVGKTGMDIVFVWFYSCIVLLVYGLLYCIFLTMGPRMPS